MSPLMYGPSLLPCSSPWPEINLVCRGINDALAAGELESRESSCYGSVDSPVAWESHAGVFR